MGLLDGARNSGPYIFFSQFDTYCVAVKQY